MSGTDKPCPFNDPSFHIGTFDPCPVCGCKGWDVDEVEEKCPEGLLGDKKANQKETAK